MSEFRPSICRICPKFCAIVAEIDDGRLVGVTGDRENEIFAGYTCPKGREMPSFVNDPGRLLWSLRRTADGSFERIRFEDAMDDIAQRLTKMVEEHGPRSVATYFGTQLTSHHTVPLMLSFMKELGSPMEFSATTLDKPGRQIAWTMLGRWMAPHRNFHDPRVIMVLGINPFVNGNGGLPLGHPSGWLPDWLADGMELIVIDPRRSDIAKRATIFLQPRPGHDIQILAAMLRIILSENRYDLEFVTQNVRGVEALRRAVDPFDPAEVARGADVSVEDLVRAARAFASGGRGFVVAGTGAHMAASGTLLEYLALCLDTVCGHWMQAGEVVRNPGVLGSPITPKAQAMDPQPAYGVGERSRVRGLGMSAAGMPSATMADEILLEGDGRIRALISVGGNPVAAVPNQAKMIKAMQSLELLVQVDPWMSHTAELATHVIAPKMPIEMPFSTQLVEGVWRSFYPTGYGFANDYAQYTSAVIPPPAGSDLVEDWEVFYELARRMGIQLNMKTTLGGTILKIGEPTVGGMNPLDMENKPTGDDLIAMMCFGSRVPLDDVKRHPHGACFPADPPVVVAPKDGGWTGRLDVGNDDMMLDLVAIPASGSERPDGEFPFRMLVRRMMNSTNSSYKTAAARDRGHNPAYMHPDDLTMLSLSSGSTVEIVSPYSSIPAIVEPDPTLRRGTVSMSFGFGRGPELDHLVREIGSSTARLLADDVLFDRYSGQPRMSNIPVRVSAKDRLLQARSELRPS